MIWEKVNEEFGSIFGTLLPGASAKLEPPEGCTYLEGEAAIIAPIISRQVLSSRVGG